MEKTDYLPLLIVIIFIILIISSIFPNNEFKINLIFIMIGLVSILIGLFIATIKEELIKITSIIVIGLGISMIAVGIISTFFMPKLNIDKSLIINLISPFAIGLGLMYKGISGLKAKQFKPHPGIYKQVGAPR